MPIDDLSKNEILEVFEKQKANRIKLGASSTAERKEKLQSLLTEVMSRQADICDAVYKDLRKSSEETKLSEIFAVTTEIRYAKRKLRSWMKPHRVPTPLAFFGSSNKVMYESIGQSLIIAPWNYPFQLAMGPLISAIAAGSSVILKPSEKSPATSELIKDMLEKLFPEEEVKVLLGGADVAATLTALPFNHIFFTGSTAVGKLVMEAAAKNLTKVTLELGGKSPVILNKDADLKIAATRIAWGKLLNAGQTCIAPDYLLVHQSVKDKFVEKLKDSIKSLYGERETLKRDNNYCRMINKEQLKKVKDIIEDAKSNGAETIYGGQIEEEDNFIAPTLIEKVHLDSKIMKEEIFGPVLPIITFKEESEIFDVVEKNPNPLALYIFSKNRLFIKKMLKKIPAGSSAVNDVVVHFVNHNLPFGGINSSGIGKSHGFAGFQAFSNEKGIMKQRKISALIFLYPPYNKIKNKLIDIVIKYL